MWDFEHPQLASKLAERYHLHYTLPSLCADELLAGRADLGLIPIASLTPELAIVPGCAIASLGEVRSIQLIVKAPHTLETLRTVAADNASRSSAPTLRSSSGDSSALLLPFRPSRPTPF